MAKTAAQRKQEQRERDRHAFEFGHKNRIDVIVDFKAAAVLRMYAEYKELTQPEVIEAALAKLLASMSHEESSEMFKLADEKAEGKRVQKLGDTRTIPLFADLDDNTVP